MESVLPQPPRFVHSSLASADFVNLNPDPLFRPHRRQVHCAYAFIVNCVPLLAEINTCVSVFKVLSQQGGQTLLLFFQKLI